MSATGRFEATLRKPAACVLWETALIFAPQHALYDILSQAFHDAGSPILVWKVRP
jgi:hypothetical protein